MAAYLTVAEFKLRTTMRQEDVDLLEIQEPGYLDTQLTAWTSRINAQLSKRYAVPFSAPVPEVILDWLVRLVTPRAYLKRGVNPSDEQFAAIKEDGDSALEELETAANSQVGLYDLPLSETDTTSGTARGGPLAYSETSPYRAFDIQVQDAEDYR